MACCWPSICNPAASKVCSNWGYRAIGVGCSTGVVLSAELLQESTCSVTKALFWLMFRDPMLVSCGWIPAVILCGGVSHAAECGGVRCLQYLLLFGRRICVVSCRWGALRANVWQCNSAVVSRVACSLSMRVVCGCPCCAAYVCLFCTWLPALNRRVQHRLLVAGLGACHPCMTLVLAPSWVSLLFSVEFVTHGCCSIPAMLKFSHCCSAFSCMHVCL